MYYIDFIGFTSNALFLHSDLWLEAKFKALRGKGREGK